MKDFSLEEEIRNGFSITKERKEIWQIELDLLNKLTEVCNKYNLKFYADAGTLLGAVRHKGFIPWDDDIDVAMLREDYDKLIAVADQEFQDPYFLQSGYNEKGYARGHAQLRNSHTTAILESEKESNCKFNQGIFMDIFVLDAVPDNITELEKEKKKIENLNRIIFNKMNRNKKITSVKDFVKKIIFSFFSLEKAFRKKEKILKSVDLNNVSNIAPLGFIFETQKRIRDKHLYDETVLLDFENTKIPAPKEYDLYLQNRYGKDYMTPKNVSTTHGGVIFDTKKSYKEYLKK